MDFGSIWQKIQELAITFYNFILEQSEVDFMLFDGSIWRSIFRGDPYSETWFFIGSLVIMILFVMLASDDFHPFKDWKYKISILNVVMFSAAVFSLHIFYKYMIILFGGLLNADASVSALDCLGSFINPISLMFYGYAVSTMDLEKRNVQAAFLGGTIFILPGLMTFRSLSIEHITIYFVAIVISVMGAVLYKKLSPYITCGILYLIYFVGKFFLIYFSKQMVLLTADTWIEKFGQYFACMQMDMILAFILLFVVFGYCAATAPYSKRPFSVKRNIKLLIVFVLLMAITIASANLVEVEARTWADMVFERDSVTAIRTTQEQTDIYSGSGTDYEIVLTVDEGEEYEPTGSEESSGDETWYEIYLDDDQSETGWVSGEVSEKTSKFSKSALAGTWIGSAGSELVLYESGACFYKDGGSSSKSGSGSWSVDSQLIIHINTSLMSYEIYAYLEDGGDTTEMVIEADSTHWNNEIFRKQD